MLLIAQSPFESRCLRSLGIHSGEYVTNERYSELKRYAQKEFEESLIPPKNYSVAFQAIVKIKGLTTTNGQISVSERNPQKAKAIAKNIIEKEVKQKIQQDYPSLSQLALDIDLEIKSVEEQT